MSNDDEHGCTEFVYTLRCKRCAHLLSLRGMATRLIMDRSTRLFSSDFPARMGMRAEPTLLDQLGKAPNCYCRLRKTFCVECDEEVGYHVARACSLCLVEGEDNGHYYLFHFNPVTAEKRANPETGCMLEWPDLRHNGNPEHHIPTLYVNLPHPEHLVCAICHELMYGPTRCSCGHTFCFGCISHELDVRKRCPLDRSPMDPADLIPDTALQLEVDRLELYCRYGVKQKEITVGKALASLWERDPSGCPAVLTAQNRCDHEQHCPFRKLPTMTSETAAQY